MSHVSSNEGLLTWGRTLIQHNRTLNPNPTAAANLQFGYPIGAAANSGSGMGGPGSNVSHSTGAFHGSHSATPLSMDGSGSYSRGGGGGGGNQLQGQGQGQGLASRFPDTAVEADQPHWRRAEQLGVKGPPTAARPKASPAKKTIGGKGPAIGSPTARQPIPMRPPWQASNPNPAVSNASGSTQGDRAGSNRIRSPAPVAPPSGAGSNSVGGGGGGMSRGTPTNSPATESLNLLNNNLLARAQASPSESGMSIRSTPPGEGRQSNASSQPANAFLDRRGRQDKERAALMEAIKQEQSRADELTHMMQRNESEFSKRQEELAEMLRALEEKNAKAGRMGSVDSRGSPGGRTSGVAPAATAADRKIRSLEEDLWNAELELERSDREEAVCGAALVRLADCIRLSEDRLAQVPELLTDTIRQAREVSFITQEVRAVAVKAPSIKLVVANPADDGSFHRSYSMTSSISSAPQVKKKYAQIVPLPSDADLRSLKGTDTFTSTITHALTANLRSVCQVLEESHYERTDKIETLNQTLQVAKAQLDEQCLTVDDAHHTLTNLQAEVQRREEEILEAAFMLKTMQERRSVSATKRSELTNQVNSLAAKLQQCQSKKSQAEGETTKMEEETELLQREKDRALREKENVVAKTLELEDRTRLKKAELEAIEVERGKQKRLQRGSSSEEDEITREVKGLRSTMQHLAEDIAKSDQHRLKLQGDLDIRSTELRKTRREGEEYTAALQELERQSSRAEKELQNLEHEMEQVLKEQIIPLRADVETEEQNVSKEKRKAKEMNEDLELVHLVLTSAEESATASTRDFQAEVGSPGTIHERSRAELMASPPTPEPITSWNRRNQLPNDGHSARADASVAFGDESEVSAVRLELAPRPAAGYDGDGVERGGAGRQQESMVRFGANNIVYLDSAPSHYPPTVSLLPSRDSRDRERSGSADRVRVKRWGSSNRQSADREFSEGGTSASSALDYYYSNQQSGFPLSPDTHSAPPRNAPLPGESYPSLHATLEPRGTSGSRPRAVIDSDAPVSTLPISPDRAPLLVKMEPRTRRPPTSEPMGYGDRPGKPRSNGGPSAGVGSEPTAIPVGLDVDQMRARMELYSQSQYA